ncbi:EAL domain-containing protein [Leifsonia shinshuensis]|uniref:EAL domain-containing protein (Putative c-di-GMP-specific phosphodiesterase class I) n=1 Tax=Leifsonia shinshuensis TaxID=150026 RepID=A0A853CPR1_9MICO|nr:EAL domain-containing protein [Leifsonia shinshuensis]NYJ22647.1 EAL domain-containing protein (putative c-di-GMP-specific phosphodiesterase class I) [Leifsonia shinshuensis]
MTTCDAVAHDLADAIAEDRLRIVFQPQIDLRTGDVVALEGLCRWTHETLGPIPPSEFVELAESTGAIHELGRFALAECCRYAATWHDRGEDVAVAVNVSPLQLATSAFFDELEREIADSGVPAENLILEVTEAEKLADPGVLAARLDIVREWGVAVSIDDFGTGHSSMDRALSLRAGELKLDRSLVARADRAAIATVVSDAHRAGMRIVAEGVETRGQLDLVREAGCDRAQGYYIARPAAQGELDAWMAARAR